MFRGLRLLQSNLVLRLGSAHAAQRSENSSATGHHREAMMLAMSRAERKTRKGAHVMSTATTKEGTENMSLVPGRPGHDELVPSRYALRVGEIDVMVVSDGVLSLPGAMLGHNVDPAVRAAWLKDMFLPPDVLEWALNVVVVRSGGRTILIDAGMGAEFPDLPRAGRLVQRLEAAGIDLASVTDVVLTHLHMDHVGGLLVDGVRDRLRPDLRVH